MCYLDDLKNDLSVKGYLEHLGTCTVDELSMYFMYRLLVLLFKYNCFIFITGNEHKNLEQSNSNLVNMIKDLALKNYKTFVKTSQCYESVYSKFDDTQHKTIILDNYLLKLKTECQEMLKQWADVKEKRHRNTLAMVWNSRIMHHALELPQLMLSCIQNNLYEDALKLADHARYLPKNIPAVKVNF